MTERQTMSSTSRVRSFAKKWSLLTAVVVCTSTTGSVLPGEQTKTYYTLYTQRTTWYGARAVCLTKGGALVDMSTSEKKDTISKLLTEDPWHAHVWYSNYDFWTGLYDVDPNKHIFLWTNSCKLQKNDIDTSERSTGCVLSETIKGLWKTVDCNQVHMFICEIPTEEGCGFHEEAVIYRRKDVTYNMVASEVECFKQCINNPKCVKVSICIGWGFMIRCSTFTSEDVLGRPYMMDCKFYRKSCVSAVVSNENVLWGYVATNVYEECGFSQQEKSSVSTISVTRAGDADARRTAINDGKNPISNPGGNVPTVPWTASSSLRTALTTIIDYNTIWSRSDRGMILTLLSKTTEHPEKTTLTSTVLTRSPLKPRVLTQTLSITSTSASLRASVSTSKSVSSSSFTSKTLTTTAPEWQKPEASTLPTLTSSTSTTVTTASSLPPITSSPPTLTTTVLSLSSSPKRVFFNSSCVCECENSKTGTNMTPEELDAELVKIMTKLTVNVTTLSSTRRMYTCAVDNRTSSSYMGYIGVVFLAFSVVFIVIFDFLRLLLFIIKWYKE